MRRVTSDIGTKRTCQDGLWMSVLGGIAEEPFWGGDPSMTRNGSRAPELAVMQTVCLMW
jgi:hypothetical protein